MPSRNQRSREEAPYTLIEAPPKALGVLDQSAFWANLGVSLLGFGGAIAILAPSGQEELSFLAAVAATIVGTALGTLVLGMMAVPGTRTGAPAMVLLRGLFGTRISYLPTVLNILQLLGWGTFELIIIAQSVRSLTGGFGPRWVYVVVAGVITTVLTIRPLGTVRILRRYVTVLMVSAMIYFSIQVFRQPLPGLASGSWSGFWVGADAALAVAVSWVPLVSDYSRHSRTSRAAFSGTFFGYSIAQSASYIVGLGALALVAGDPDRVFDPFLALPLGALFFSFLVLREVDLSFADSYSTAVSIQNIRPRTDRRILSIGIGVAITLLAIVLDMGRYADFLYLIGSVFVPMAAVFAVDYFLLTGSREWNLSADAPARWMMLLPWFLGFATYQLINPGGIGPWAAVWTRVRELIGFAPAPWMSASVFSFVIAGVLAYLIGRFTHLASQGVSR